MSFVKPLIGMSSSMEVDESYYMVANDNVKAIANAGGIPLILPHLANEADVAQLAEEIAGLYLTGGYDIDPTLFGEEPHPKLGTIIPSRDVFEMELIKQMLKKDKPILAVCRGCQILNIVAGGDMYQDIYTQCDGELLQHSQKAPKGHASHYVNVLEGSLLHDITQMEVLRVNSRHHQANREVIDPFQVSGTANDGIIESIESKEHAFVLGLQWHPENLVFEHDLASFRIFQRFIAACKS